MRWKLWHTAAAAPVLAVGLAVAAMAAPESAPSADSLLTAQLQKQVQAQQAQITRLEGELKVTMLDKLLFPEGGWQLGTEGEKALQRIAPTLRGLKDTRIVVDGYTDDMPIAAVYRDRFATNWELAGERASVVVRYLVAQGVDPDHLTAASHGERHPVAGNETAAGRDRNRRIEVTLVGPGA